MVKIKLIFFMIKKIYSEKELSCKEPLQSIRVRFL